MADKQSFNELALFAGAGGGILGGKLLGWRTVCAVERDAYPAAVLAQRQNDGLLEAFPIWSDVTTFDGKPWRGIVDVISGGFPCQDISAAGKGAGITGERSGLWKEFARIIGEVRPRYVFVENSPMLTSRGLGVVLGDLAEMGFDAEWGVISAENCGAPHKRERIWIVAHSTNSRVHERRGFNDSCEVVRQLLGNVSDGIQGVRQEKETVLADAAQLQRNGCKANGQRGKIQKFRDSNGEYRPDNNWWDSEPDVGRVANGVAHRVDKLKAIGNGQVSRVAATAFSILSEGLTND